MSIVNLINPLFGLLMVLDEVYFMLAMGRGREQLLERSQAALTSPGRLDLTITSSIPIAIKTP